MFVAGQTVTLDMLGSKRKEDITSDGRQTA